jgi:hypothetical protein
MADKYGGRLGELRESDSGSWSVSGMGLAGGTGNPTYSGVTNSPRLNRWCQTEPLGPGPWPWLAGYRGRARRTAASRDEARNMSQSQYLFST